MIGSGDGYWQGFVDEGLAVPNGMSGQTYGATLKWNTPIRGLMLGASESRTALSGIVQAPMPFGPGGSYVTVNGNFDLPMFYVPYYFGRYERGKVMLAAEATRLAVNGSLTFPVVGANAEVEDIRSFYGMASYKPAEKLTVGGYYSYGIDHHWSHSGPGRFQRDYTLSGRYDFSGFFYAKAEEHIVGGTLYGYSQIDNPAGLKTDTTLTIVKVGVNF